MIPQIQIIIRIQVRIKFMPKSLITFNRCLQDPENDEKDVDAPVIFCPIYKFVII